MVQLDLSLYSRHLLGSVNDPSTVVRKQSILFSLGLVDHITRSLRIDDWKDLLAVFRIVNFTSADLVIVKGYSVEEIVNYRNPCNLRRALDQAIAALEGMGIDNQVTKSQLLHEVSDHFSGSIWREVRPADHFGEADIPLLSQMAEGLVVRKTTAGYSLFSKKQFSRGETVICLSGDDAISLLSSFRDPLFPAESLYMQGLHPDTIFLLYLIHLRDTRESLSNEVHRQFFADQPESYDTLFELPLDIVKAFDEPDLLDSVIRQNDFLKSICKSLEPAPEFSDMLWAKSLCTSRAFSLPITPKNDIEQRVIKEFYPDGMITTILPGVHFINHDFRAQLQTPEVLSDGSIVVKAYADVSEGLEVFLIYGGFTNKEMMLNYGFYIPENPYDSIEREDGTIIRRGVLKSRETVRADVAPTPDVPDRYKALVHGYLADRQKFHNMIV